MASHPNAITVQKEPFLMVEFEDDTTCTYIAKCPMPNCDRGRQGPDQNKIIYSLRDHLKTQLHRLSELTIDQMLPLQKKIKKKFVEPAQFIKPSGAIYKGDIPFIKYTVKGKWFGICPVCSKTRKAPHEKQLIILMGYHLHTKRHATLDEEAIDKLISKNTANDEDAK